MYTRCWNCCKLTLVWLVLGRLVGLSSLGEDIVMIAGKQTTSLKTFRALLNKKKKAKDWSIQFLDEDSYTKEYPTN